MNDQESQDKLTAALLEYFYAAEDYRVSGDKPFDVAYPKAERLDAAREAVRVLRHGV